MNSILQLTLITAISGVGGTGLGGVLSSFFKRDSKEIVSILLSFAGGVMLSVVCFDLISEAIVSIDANTGSGILLIALYISIGYGVVAVLNHLVDKASARRDKARGNGKARSRIFNAGLVMAAAIAIHNFPEGMVIGASYAGDNASLEGSAILLAVVIGLHNIPEGMAVATPLIAGGMAKPKAVSITALSGLPTVAGALAGYKIGMLGPGLLAFSLCFAGGAMLYVVFSDLLPEAILYGRSKLSSFSAFAGILTGMLIVYA